MCGKARNSYENLPKSAVKQKKRKTMTLPDPQPKFTPYLSIIPHRKPQQKTHSNIGHAKNAVNGKWNTWRGAECDMQIFEFSDDGWQLLYDIKRGDTEPPWREGELAEKARKKQAQIDREDATARKVATKEAEEAYNIICEEHGYAPFTLLGYVTGYVNGYMRAREKSGRRF
jgi:hypothetical protein